MKEDWTDIVFYTAQWPDTGSEVDLTFCPRAWSYRKVVNKFKARNPEWDFKKKKPIIAFIIDNKWKPPTA